MVCFLVASDRWKLMKRKPREGDPIVPTNWDGTPEQWKEKKKEEFRVLVVALDKFNYGSAYVPQDVHLALWDVQRGIHRMKIGMDQWLPGSQR